jgi:hypothetical protein
MVREMAINFQHKTGTFIAIQLNCCENFILGYLINGSVGGLAGHVGGFLCHI